MREESRLIAEINAINEKAERPSLLRQNGFGGRAPN